MRNQRGDGLSWTKVRKVLLDTYGAEALPDKRDVKKIERMLSGSSNAADVECTSDYKRKRTMS